MWPLVDKVFKLALLTVAASTVFVFVALLWASLSPTDPRTPLVDPTQATVEVRLSSHGDVSRVYVGQPIVVDVVLLNLEARRARNRGQIDPAQESAAAEIALDAMGGEGSRPWERRLEITMSTPGGATVLNRLDWHARLHDAPDDGTGRRLGMAPARATLVLEGADMARLLPGMYILSARLPSDLVPLDRVTVIPLEIELLGAPTNDVERAAVSLAVARVAALRGEPAQAVEAGLTALALDPLQDEALSVVAEAWEQQGDLERAIEWYERYLETISASAADQRAALVDYIDALRRQRD